MKNVKYEELFKQNRVFYGEFHPLTLWSKLCKDPLKAPLVLCILPFKILKFMSAGLQRACYKYALKCAWGGEAHSYSHAKVGDFIKPLALYLPQYHPILENDKWWGKGFTEWTNVKKTRPLFEGHYQPHVPHKDLGYYDLSDINVMRTQAKIAQKYGVYGFCFYYYYFEQGKRLLEKPLQNYLKATDIDFPFCFAWANENWTRRWDGGNNEIIMAQDYDEENMRQMLKEMLPAFQDKRYIKIEGKPVLFVYRAEIVPQIKKLVLKWRAFIKTQGFDDLYLISMQNFKQKNPLKMGFDAAAEFAPQIKRKALCLKPDLFLREKALLFDADIWKMEDVVTSMCAQKKVSYPLIKCVCPSWDNTPRRQKNKPRIIVNATVSNFIQFLKKAVQETFVRKLPANGLLLINAWNEWGEGAHLEPDEKNGYAYLEALRQVQETRIEDLDHV